MRQAWAEVHLEAIRKNIRFLMSKIDKNTQFMGVVKADGYGHGAVPIARILEEEGAAQFAVAITQAGRIYTADPGARGSLYRRYSAVS